MREVDAVGACLGWIVAALLLGYLLGVRAWQTPLTLRQRCARVAVYRARRLEELSALLGGPAQEMQALPDGHTLRTWRQRGYSITLRFDADDVCLGVYDEHG